MRGGDEGFGIGAGAGEVPGKHRGAQVGGDVAARVAEQRDEIIGGVADQHVLKVEQADTGMASALR